ncbi:hypothetical protein RHGRI_017328 [Rhododendron griersonianum]|uniref:Uncharacterized protein n=1 Tax=Rhododendron griersonianum TaxID=479676 RepID=A0AAV6JXP7_9ERIC|nr:hypothetical protein RHGRI_017328 [Rhododendron griersonianum]
MEVIVYCSITDLVKEKDVHTREMGMALEGELLIEARGDLISFRLRDVQVKGLGIHNNIGGWYKVSLHTEAYVESLVLLGSPEQTMEDEVACEEEKKVEVRCGEEEIESKELKQQKPGIMHFPLNLNFVHLLFLSLLYVNASYSHEAAIESCGTIYVQSL